jgi:hypothetical protein
VELAIQQWLRAWPKEQADLALQTLEERYAIKARRHGKLPHLVLLKYDQISSPFKEELVQDCRGIILCQPSNWAVRCLTYRKFFNHGESLAAEIDWPSATVCEKLDGSLIQLYYVERWGWEVATSGTPDAETPINDFGVTFKQLFWDTFKAQGLRQEALDENFCYAFELCSPINRVVVRHEAPKLILHGVRNLSTMEEEFPEAHAFNLGVPTPQVFNYQTAFEAEQGAMHIDPLKQEGYVARDRFFRRVKIKSPAYVALHHAKDGLLSRRMMANVVRAGEAPELRTALDAFPELAGEFDKLVNQHEWMVRDALSVFNFLLLRLPVSFTRKEFASAATVHKQLSGVLFHLLDRNVVEEAREPIVRAYFAALHEKAYMRLLDIKE